LRRHRHKPLSGHCRNTHLRGAVSTTWESRILAMFLPHKWDLCRNIGCLDRVAMPPLPRTFVLQWLQHARRDPSKMIQMRGLLSGETGVVGLSRLSDHAVLTRIAELLWSGRLHIHETPRRMEQSPGGKVATSVPLPFPRRKRPPSAAPFREQPMDSATFLADIDLVVQAATLMDAARSGKPFCPE
jgi:hypothetical protein